MATIAKRIYSEKLLDPLWQQKKSSIQIRDQFTCKKCGDKKTELHVHHRHYVNGRLPWEYPDELLVTLCKNCHAEEELYANIGNEMLQVLHHYGYFNTDIKDILNGLIDKKVNKNG